MEKEKTIAQGKPSIPQDIIYEIFSRLSVKSLTRFMCVSRFCNTHISSLISFKFLAWTYSRKKFYTIEQKSHVPCESKLIESGESTNNKKGSAHLINELNGFPYHNLAYVEGLLLLWNSSELPAFIFNTSTREVTSLSCLDFMRDDEIDEYHIMLGFEPEKKKYKILLVTYPCGHWSPLRYWIFTLGTGESWREVKPISDRFVTPPSLKGVCIDGVIYFFVFSHRGGYFKMAIFNLRIEKFRIISLWNKYGDVHDSVGNMSNCSHLIEVKGKLAIVDVRGGEAERMTLRILQNSETEEWVNHIIVFPQLLCREVAKENIFYLKNYVCSNTLNGEIVLMNSLIKPNWMFFYDLKKNSWREIEVLGFGEKVNIVGICSYVESLLPLGYV